MARYTESVCRQCRREGEKLFLKGDRCYTAKCAIIKRHTPPGQHQLRHFVLDAGDPLVRDRQGEKIENRANPSRLLQFDKD